MTATMSDSALSSGGAAAAALANEPLSAEAGRLLGSDLRDFARARLPAAMVPARFVVLPELPKLPNGKTDRRALPAVSAAAAPAADESSYVAPATPRQTRIAAVWAEVLGVARVGLRDGFFDMGGDSLHAARLVARLSAETGAPVSVRELLENPTVELLAAATGGSGGPGAAAGPRVNPRSLDTAALAAEAVLPADIVPEPGAQPPAEAPYRRILLTGGTGYTGAFLARELLDRSAATLHVLVRARSAGQGLARVRTAMAQYGVWRDGDERRIRAVPGDLARPYFGLDRQMYQALARDIEMIVHNGAWSSYALPYRRLKPVNVLGTQEVLRLAARHRVKPVHYISSLAVYPGRPGEHHWGEQDANDPEGVIGGYRQTKWVGDRMMSQATERGLPACVYRPGQITGAQATGSCSTDTFLNAAVKGCIQLGAAFDVDVLIEATPVDYCAAAVAHTALGGRWHGAAFNLPGAHPLPWNRLVDLLSECGYPLRRLAYGDWYRELTAAAERGEENELARFLPLFGPEAPAEDVGYLGSRPAFGTADLRSALAGSGIDCAPPDSALIRRYLDYFVSVGYLAAPQRTRP